MYGFNILDRKTWRPRYNVAVNVSKLFVARYERDARDADPVLKTALETRHATYNLALMSDREWLDGPAYQAAYRTHDMRHVVDAPVIGGGDVIGSVHFADDRAAREVTPRDVQMVEAMGRVVGCAIEGIWARERLEAERDQALAVLELAATAVVVSDPAKVELRTNDAARRLLADVEDAEGELQRLLAVPPAADGGFSRRLDVTLVGGGSGTLHGHTSGLVTVLELDRELPGIAPALLAPLTSREREIAGLVVDGLADREIAEQLCLSHHTVSQYVKQVNRKLDVDSRVALTRLLLRR